MCSFTITAPPAALLERALLHVLEGRQLGMASAASVLSDAPDGCPESLLVLLLALCSHPHHSQSSEIGMYVYSYA